MIGITTAGFGVNRLGPGITPTVTWNAPVRSGDAALGISISPTGSGAPAVATAAAAVASCNATMATCITKIATGDIPVEACIIPLAT